LEETFKDRSRDEILEEVVQDLSEHWSSEWAAALKLRLGLSEHKWDVLAESIVGTYVPDDEPHLHLTSRLHLSLRPSKLE
jgi:hypothetical protein